MPMSYKKEIFEQVRLKNKALIFVLNGKCISFSTVFTIPERSNLPSTWNHSVKRTSVVLIIIGALGEFHFFLTHIQTTFVNQTHFHMKGCASGLVLKQRY